MDRYPAQFLLYFGCRIKMLTNLLVWQPKTVALQVASEGRIAQSFAALSLSPSPCPFAALSLSPSPCPLASLSLAACPFAALSFARPACPLAALSLPARQTLAPS
jgi:hypothetical protein